MIIQEVWFLRKISFQDEGKDIKLEERETNNIGNSKIRISFVFEHIINKNFSILLLVGLPPKFGEQIN